MFCFGPFGVPRLSSPGFVQPPPLLVPTLTLQDKMADAAELILNQYISLRLQCCRSAW